jgi:FkbM family methyltransferase
MIFTYWTGPSNLDQEFSDFWQAHVPEFRVFSDEDVLPIIESRHPELSLLYRRIRIPACRSDIARLILLEEFGGLYIDAHVSCPNFGCLAGLLSECGNFELGVFDVVPFRTRPGDRHICNTSLYSLKDSKYIAALINKVGGNLIGHYEREKNAPVAGGSASADRPEYNIASLTGAWNIRMLFFEERSGALEVRKRFESSVLAIPLQNNDTSPLGFYRHYRYRSPGTHWSERQKNEPLFDIPGGEAPAPSTPRREQRDLHNAIEKGDTLNHQEKYNEALTLLRPELAFAPGDHWLNFHLGRAYSGIGDRERATQHFLAAVESGYPHRVGAMYEVVRHDLLAGVFDRVDLLDQALSLPGEITERDGAAGQKRYYYFQILFLKALLLLKKGDYVACEEVLNKAFDFSLSHDERLFGFDWVLDLLRVLPAHPDLPNLEYLRQRMLCIDMIRDVINYQEELGRIPDTAFVLEIGAMDGIRFDPLHGHLVARRWNAVVVEPLPDMFSLLKTNYETCPWIQCANVAISETTGPISMFRVRPDATAAHGLGEWIVGISSAIKGPTLSYLGDIVSEEVVRGLTFVDFVEEFGIKQIDVLQVDTEGYDWKILEQIDLDRWKIGLIHIEVLNLRPCDRLKVFTALRAAGYEFHYDRMDVTAVRGRLTKVAGEHAAAELA